MSKELNNYLEKNLNNNISFDILEKALIEKGWDKKTIDIAYLQIKLKLFFKNLIANKKVAFAIPLIVILAVGFYIFYPKDEVYNYNLILPQTSGFSDNFTMASFNPLMSVIDFEYFQKVEEELINQKADFIKADLTSMELTFYKNGKIEQKYKILSKGKEGSWWETPAGIYKIGTKEINHFSTFGNVYMPFSMQFEGNFFIHGWPYYPDGTSVGSSYSGGCIRLSNEDAKDLYNKIKIGIPVLVLEKDFEKDTFSYQYKKPVISANNYLIADLKSNFVFLEKNSENKVPIASISKLITALVTTEYINLDKQIIVDPSSLVETTIPRLQANQKISVYDLLKLLLAESSNEAAEALANFTGRDYFIELMNSKAQSIGMTGSSFEDPSGLSKNNISSSRDLFLLLKYIYNNRSFILKLTNGDFEESPYDSQFNDLRNFNNFEKDGFIGGKIGETPEAGKTIVAAFELDFNGQKRPIAIILLNSTDLHSDVNIILNYLKTSFSGK